jgi:putative phosphoesterase
MRVAVLSDIHANARSLKAGLDQVRAEGAEHVVLLGDLLTYGVDVDEVLDLVEDQVSRGATLVMGNHDKLYLDLDHGDSRYYERLPAWLQESVDFCMSRLDHRRFQRLPWTEEWTARSVLAAHANPFGVPDWTYLNATAERSRARDLVQQRGYRLGVFGHTHRGFVETRGRTRLANPGSLGQPRQESREATWLLVDLCDIERPRAKLKRVHYEVRAHLESLRKSDLGPLTIAKLSSYFLRD